MTEHNRAHRRLPFEGTIFIEVLSPGATQLQSSEVIMSLMDCEYYDKSVLTPETNELEAIELDEVCIRSGFAYTSLIEAGEDFY